MRIKRVEPIAVSFPMKKPVFMAGVEIRRADNVLVRIEADNGVVGWGEAASAPTMTGETVESMMAAIRYLIPALEGGLIDHFNKHVAVNSGYRVAFGSVILFFLLGTIFVSRIRSVR